MKVVKFLVLGLLGLVVLLVLVAFVLPRKYEVVREIDIDAPASRVFVEVNSLPNWKKWMAWVRKDPNMTISYSGPESGVGCTSKWESESQGSGEMEIKESVPDQTVVYELRFPGFNPSTGTMTLTESNGKTHVRWADAGDLGNNPMSRWFGLFLDGMIGPDFEAGLTNLKTLCETPVEEPAAEEVPAAEGNEGEEAPAAEEGGSEGVPAE